MLRSLFLDLNAYFASVEQQVQPDLRGLPVAVVPVLAQTTCCIAASYEAKRFGIKTGTSVRDAKRLCPSLRLIEARPELYVRFHHRVLNVVDQFIPIEAVHSIDELSCRLLGEQRHAPNAIDLAQRIKLALSRQIGQCIRCSIGLAPNRFLAKVASDMQKPDGLVVIESHELPDRLFGLELTDLPGIGRNMDSRLRQQGVTSVRQLCALTENDLAKLWHSVVGRYWWHWLRGHEPPTRLTHRRTVGHSHVLAPQLRSDRGAHQVFIRLIHKAGARLRRLDYTAGELWAHVSYLDRQSWMDHTALGGCQDTLTMIQAFERLWSRRPHGTPVKASVTLTHLTAPTSATLPLFEQQHQRLELARVMDRLNSKYGPHTLYFAGMFGAQQTAPMRIAFSSIPIPELEW